MRWSVVKIVPSLAVVACVIAGCGDDVEDETGTVLDGVLEYPADMPVNPDPMCTSTFASSGNQCERDCIVHCGFESIGTKVCTCISGVFTQCPCFKPPTYQGAETAPLCDSPQNRALPMDEMPCDTEWAQCIGTDPVSGTTPRGCVCLDVNGSGSPRWSCGSTNRWFRLEGT